MQGPEILKSKVISALAKMNRNEATGPDGIITEMLLALDDFGVDIFSEVIK